MLECVLQCVCWEFARCLLIELVSLDQHARCGCMWCGVLRVRIECYLIVACLLHSRRSTFMCIMSVCDVMCLCVPVEALFVFACALVPAARELMLLANASGPVTPAFIRTAYQRRLASGQLPYATRAPIRK